MDGMERRHLFWQRGSEPTEQLLLASLLQAFYGIRSERLMVEKLHYNMLFRWFVGLSPDDPILNNDSSARVIPLTHALIAEGFLEWTRQQGAGLLFLEPKPPAVDPRLSH